MLDVVELPFGSDEESIEFIILVDLCEVDAGGPHPGHQFFVIMPALQFDAYDGGSGFFVGFLHVFESGDVVGWSEYMAYEFF